MTHAEALRILSISQPSEAREAYRRLCLVHHPDKGGDPEKFRQITAAHEALGKPEPLNPAEVLGIRREIATIDRQLAWVESRAAKMAKDDPRIAKMRGPLEKRKAELEEKLKT